MILRRYGKTVQSVEPNFNARAMNEIGFLKSDAFSMPADEFESSYERVAEHALTAHAEGDVQNDAEEGVLQQLRAQIDQLLASLSNGNVLVVESEMGKDYPKMRERVTNVVVESENRLHFTRTIDPPLRIGIYTQRKS